MKLHSMRSLEIGGYSFKISYTTDPDILAAMAEDHGSVSISRQIITINATDHIQHQWNSINHEIKHIVNHLCSIDDDSKEEEEVTLTTNMMCAFWRNKANRKWHNALRAYILGELQ